MTSLDEVLEAALRLSPAEQEELRARLDWERRTRELHALADRAAEAEGALDDDGLTDEVRARRATRPWD